ncbi:MAG: mechanosensitive ion channel [Candidatus Melainabacteria bacterium]|nr:MAG: mechanosensitive ion channel [Candidatus Melainabacteria bacterium]
MEILFYPIAKNGDDQIMVINILALIIGGTLWWWLAAIASRFIVKKFAMRMHAFSSSSRSIVRKVLLVITGLIGTSFIMDVSNIDVHYIFSYVDNLFNITIFHLGKTSITLWTLFYVLVLGTVLMIAANRAHRLLLAMALKNSHLDAGASNAVATITKYAIMAFGSVIILQSAGVDLTALTVFAGAIGLGLSFGLQNITSNLISGLIVLIERPVKIGDKIVVGNYSGIVQKIALRATTILTSDNIEVIVPNSDFISKNVVNLSLSTRRIPIKIPFVFNPDIDAQTVRRVLLEAANEHQGVLKDPAPLVLFESIEREQVTIYLKVATVTYADKTASLKSELNFSVFQKLQENVFTPEQMHKSQEKKSEMVVKPGQTNISINTEK